MQALGGGSPELRALADARDGRAETPLTDDPDAPEGEPVPIPIEDALDLHAFAPGDIPAVVEDYLAEAQARGFREVRLIHGRGRGVQRATVRAVLARHPLVEAYADAPPARGGWGATLVRLKARPG